MLYYIDLHEIQEKYDANLLYHLSGYYPTHKGIPKVG